MPRQAFSTSRAVARLLRDRRRQLGLSLREVQKRASAAGTRIPFSTLARIEQGRVDPGVKRLHLLMNLYDLPMQMAGDLLDVESLAGKAPSTSDPDELYKKGVEHWRRGNTREGVAHLIALRERINDNSFPRAMRQKALLSFAIAAGSLGKYRLSLNIVENLLLEGLDDGLLVSVLVQAGVVWNGLGSPEAALAFLERAESHLVEHDPQRRAWVLHEKADAYMLLRRPELAERALSAAVDCYRETGDVYGEGRAAGMRIRSRLAAGDLTGALSAAREARVQAERHGLERLRLLRALDEGQVLVALGDAAAGLEVLNQALLSAMAAEDQVARFYCHHHLWRAHRRAGDDDRAELELKAACYYVRFVDEASDEATEIRKRLGAERKEAGP